MGMHIMSASHVAQLEKRTHDDGNITFNFEDTEATRYLEHHMQYGAWTYWKQWLFLIAAAHAKAQLFMRFHLNEIVTKPLVDDVTPFLADVAGLAADASNLPYMAFRRSPTVLEAALALQTPFPLARTLWQLQHGLMYSGEEATALAAEMQRYLPLVAAMSGYPCPTPQELEHRRMHLMVGTDESANADLRTAENLERYERVEWCGTKVTEDDWPYAFYIDMLLTMQHASEGGCVYFT